MKQYSRKLLYLCLSSLISVSQISPVYAAEPEEHVHEENPSGTLSESQNEQPSADPTDAGTEAETSEDPDIEAPAADAEDSPKQEEESAASEKNAPAAPQAEVIDDVMINPLYEDILNDEAISQIEEDLDKQDSQPVRRKSGVSTYSVDQDNVTYFTEPEEAAPVVRNAMENRETEITFHYAAPGYSRDLMLEILDEALEHTGIGTQGDYLKWQYGGAKFGGSYYTVDGTAFMDLKFTISYYTTSEQEKEVSDKLTDVYDELALDQKTNDQKADAIYRYICDNVTYNYDTLNDPSLTIGYTAYGALINGSSVCQGYAVLLYRMLLDQNIDARFISGKGNDEAHGWNIVKMDDFYYLADSTWDAGSKNFTYFLKGSKDFPSHTADESYTTAEFTEKYPISTKNYVLCLNPQYRNGTIEWSEDYESATAVFPCETCSRKTEVPAEVTRSAVEADCTHNGEITYTAVAQYQGAEAKDEKKVIIEALGHNYEAVFEWADDYSSANAVFTCSRCQDTETVPAEIRLIEKTESDCKNPGQNVYEATASLKDGNGNILLTRTDTQTETLPLKEHDYSGAIEWNGDHSFAAAVFTCSNCNDQKTVDAVLSETVNKEATCTEKGSRTVTAKAVLKDENGAELASVSDSVTLEIPSLEHDYSGIIEWSKDGSAASGIFTCRNCNDQKTVDAVLSETVNKEATCTEKGSRTVTAKAILKDKNGTELASASDSRTEVIPVFDHEYADGFCSHCGKEQPVSSITNPFRDVPENEWYYGVVMTAYQRNLMTGLSEGVFGPDENISRGMVAVILWRMSGAPETAFEPVFDDVQNANDYYAQAVTWAANEGLISGYDVKEDGKKLFGPDDNVTREQLAVFFCRYAAYQGKDTSARNDLSWFEDKDSVSPYARTAMQWMVGEGMIQGEGGKRLNPLGEAQRSHMAKFSVLMDNFVRNPEKDK